MGKSLLLRGSIIALGGVAVFLLTACGITSGFGGPELVFHTYIYTADQAGNSITGYYLNSVDASFVKIGTTAIPAQGALVAGPNAVLGDPLGRFLYSANATSGTISAYGVGLESGNLTPIGTYASGPNATPNPTALAVDPLGQHLWVSNQYTSEVIAFDIGVDGSLGNPRSVPTDTGPVAILLDPAGKYLYVSTYSGHIDIFSWDSGSGSLTEVNHYDFASANYRYALRLAFASSGNLLYLSMPYTGSTAGVTGQIAILSVDTGSGALGASGMGPVSTAGGTPAGLCLTPDGNYLYVTEDSSSNGGVDTFRVDSSSGALTALPFYSGGTVSYYQPISPIQVAVDPDSTYVFVLNSGGPNFHAIPYSADTGDLTVWPNGLKLQIKAVGATPVGLTMIHLLQPRL